MIERKPWCVVWNTLSDTDGVYCDSLEDAKDVCVEILIGWMESEPVYAYGVENATEEEIDDWNYMVMNCYTEIYKYNPDTDEYEEYCFLSEDDEREIGFVEIER